MSCARNELPQSKADPATSEPPDPTDPYISWLQKNKAPLFRAGQSWWRPYHGVLLAASLNPQPIEIPPPAAQRLLRSSGCMLLRHFTRTFETPTEFWHVTCRDYDFEKLSANARSKVRRARKRCSVRPITGEWLIANGYPCYAAAHTRYENAPVLSRAEFEANEGKSAGGPFECWGVFIEEELAGYARCAVGDDYAATLVLKYHPAYLGQYSAYALMDAILTRYVQQQRKLVTNGFRSLAHDTNIQEFLEQFGFRKVYCDLRIVYRTSLKLGIGFLYPFRTALDHMPEFRLLPRVKNLLAQEQIRRSFIPSRPIAGVAPGVVEGGYASMPEPNQVAASVQR